jgi:hypothetical protein
MEVNGKLHTLANLPLEKEPSKPQNRPGCLEEKKNLLSVAGIALLTHQ